MRAAKARTAAIALGSTADDLGPCGAASGLAAVAKAALCIDEQIIPGVHPSSACVRESAASSAAVFLPEGSQVWIRNRADGPRRAGVVTASKGGDCQLVTLAEDEHESPRPSLGSLPAGVAIQECRQRGSKLALFAIEAGDRPGLVAQIRKLAAWARDDRAREIEDLARQWWQSNGNDARHRYGMAIVAHEMESLVRLLGEAQKRAIDGPHDEPKRADDFNRIYQGPSLPGTPGRMAFVYPGLGNQYPGMGASFGVLWPDVLARKTPRTNSCAINSTPESGGPMMPRTRSTAIASRFSAAFRWLAL